MLTNVYIEKIFKKLPGFLGVFSSDNIKRMKNNNSLIINFDKMSEPGSHFVAVFKKNNICYYFDSLNLGFVPTDIAGYLVLEDKIINLSSNIQNINSSYCGFYCILFILSMNISEKYWINIDKKFQKQKIENDKICINLICETVKKLSRNKKSLKK